MIPWKGEGSHLIVPTVNRMSDSDLTSGWEEVSLIVPLTVSLERQFNKVNTGYPYDEAL